MKKLVCGVIVCIFGSAVFATPYLFESASGKSVEVEVEAWAGSGANESILVVDWNRLDNGAGTVTESHAFGFRWNGTKYVSDMLTAFDTAGIFELETGYGGAFLSNIKYSDSAEPNGQHYHIESGSWNLASTDDPDSNWGTWGNSQWDFNAGGMTQELLVDGQFEGANAIKWFGTLPSYGDDQLDIPIVPEPATMALVGLGGLFLRRGHKA